MIFDVAIIGAGIVGSCIAHELSKYKLNVCFLEKEDDVSCGTSKANSGIIHAGYDPEPGTLMAKLNVKGAELYPELAQKLHFDFKQTGSFVIAFSEADRAHIEKLLERGKTNGVKELRIIEKDELKSLEPEISDEACAALFAPTAGIVNPYQATWAFAENAVQNGVKLYLNSQVRSIAKAENDGLFEVQTAKGSIKTRFVVNAAGLYADKINGMAGARAFKTVPRRGEYCLLDNNCKDIARHVLFQPPSKLGKGVLVTPTVDGNILVGPSADSVKNADETATTQEGQQLVFDTACRTIPNLPRRNIINSFAGVRALGFINSENDGLVPVNDFIIEEDASVKGFITVGGIASPGLTAAPAIAIYVCGLLEKAGLQLTPNQDFVPVRKGIESFARASATRKAELIEENPLYGRIICRCEMITEAEIVQAVHSAVGASDLDGVKRRTRSGMGRCQGGFCSPRVTEIISRELKIPMIEVTKKGGCSYVLYGKTRSTDEVHHE